MKWKLAIVSLLVIPTFAFGAATLSVTAPGGGNALVLPAGTTQFNVEFRITVGEEWLAVGAGLEDLGGNDRLSIKGRVTPGDGVTAPPGAGAMTPAITGAAGKLDPVSANIGYFDFSAVENYPAASNLVLATLTIKNASTPADNAAIPNGTYMLNIGNPGGGITVGDIDGANIPVSIGAPLAVTIIPEPASLLLLGLGGLFLRRRR